jgi:hypothetical protein
MNSPQFVDISSDDEMDNKKFKDIKKIIELLMEVSREEKEVQRWRTLPELKKG